MPKLKRGSGGGSHGHKAKPGTHNRKQAAARDAARTAAIATVGTMADEALEALLSPPPAPAEQVVSPAIEPACEPSKGELDAYKRMAIVSAYQRLNCPPECEWGKHGGTLRQLADAFDMPDPCDYRPIKEVLLRYLNGEDVWYSQNHLPASQEADALTCGLVWGQGSGTVSSIALHTIFACISPKYGHFFAQTL